VSGKTVLIVEDEDNILEAVRYNLTKEGYDVIAAGDGEVGLDLARTANPDLVILDIMLPKLGGFQVCQLLRRETDIPIIMLTARGEETDRVVGLELGADDYVTKPFSMRELLARVRALLRRSDLTNQKRHYEALSYVKTGNLTLDLARHQATISDQLLNLKPREFALLVLLVSNNGRAFSRDQILEELWGHNYIGDVRTVDVHIRWLRQKIEVDPSTPKRIITIRGIGYRFEE
jgi:two-component system OmpR family response regulator